MSSVPGDKTDVNEKASEPQTLSIYQQEIIANGLKEKLVPDIWAYLGGTDVKLAEALQAAIKDLPKHQLTSPEAVIDISYMSASSKKLSLVVDGNPPTQFYRF